jgi:hypothetical protein
VGIGEEILAPEDPFGLELIFLYSGKQRLAGNKLVFRTNPLNKKDF